MKALLKILAVGVWMSLAACAAIETTQSSNESGSSQIQANDNKTIENTIKKEIKTRCTDLTECPHEGP
jgi:hypothetical protein